MCFDMNRYIVIVVFVLIIVFIIGIVGYYRTNHNSVIKDKYVPKSPKMLGVAISTVQSKYHHTSTKSDGRANIFNEDDECKLWGAQDKIRNGTNTDAGDFPCMALLEYLVDDNMYSFDCGGSLFTKRYVITAAHCLGPDKVLVNVRLGEHDINKNPDCIYDDDCQPDPINVGIERIIRHEQYSSDDYVNDIGLIRLSMDIPYIDFFIKPICIPELTISSPAGQLVEVVGWGNTGLEKQSGILQKIRIKIFDWEKCRQKFDPYQIYPSQLCAGGNEGKDACVRDSGGPLVLQSKRKTYIEGIVSYGNGCGKDGFPGVYTRVGYYYDWIKNNLEP